MKFLANMGISPDTVAYLQSRGYDAIHLMDEGLAKMSDSQVLAKARSEGRIVLTHDLDFGDLMAASGTSSPSVILFRLHDMRPHSVNHHLLQVIDRFRSELEQGVIITITEGNIRVREVPIRTD